jgi:hypothetical protein
MANLATATSVDRETLLTLIKAIATLTEQLKAKGIWAKFQEAELKLLLGGTFQCYTHCAYYAKCLLFEKILQNQK